jgi:hypothetical protein
MSAAQLEKTELPEIDVVRCWRLEELLRAGFDDADATEIAFHTEIDLHLAASLVRSGCPSGTAARIVL